MNNANPDIIFDYLLYNKSKIYTFLIIYKKYGNNNHQ